MSKEYMCSFYICLQGNNVRTLLNQIKRPFNAQENNQIKIKIKIISYKTYSSCLNN